MLLDPTRWISYLAAILCLIAIALVASAEESEPVGEDLLAGAEARIEEHRRADVELLVQDASGNPIPEARLTIKQTRHAFLFGSNIFKWGRVGDPQGEAKYRERFAELFNFATLPFYWTSYERRQGEPMYDSSEAIARWCREQGIRTKGHPLAWNHSEPHWLPAGPDAILDLQLGRIRDCVDRFEGLIDTWDVVNEATHFDRPEFERRSPKFTAMWDEVGQVEFTRRCFQQARQTNRKAVLLINDYRVDVAYEQLIEQLVDEEGKPLYDVIGIQSHQHGGTWSNEKIWDVCERLSRFGAPLHFTETTILSGKQGWRGNSRTRGSWPSTPEGEKLQAREVERFYTMLYSHPAVEAITWWDFSDLHAWQGAPAGFLRGDMSPKPAYEVLHKLIKERWWTDTQATTDAKGIAEFRGTVGDYQVTVEAANGKPISLAMTLAAGDTKQITLQVR